MDKNKLILPISILLGCIILGGFYYKSGGGVATTNNAFGERNVCVMNRNYDYSAPASGHNTFGSWVYGEPGSTDLRVGGTHRAVAAGDNGLQHRAGQAEAGVARQPVYQIIVIHQAVAQVADGGEGVLLDGVVGGFAADAGLDRLHHDGGGHQERQIVPGFRGDDRRPRVHLPEDG